jgi:hypothetical protein
VQGHPFQCRRQSLGQATANADLVPRRLHLYLRSPAIEPAFIDAG